ARVHGYNVFMCNSDDDIEIERSTIELLKNRKVDGIIIAPIGLDHAHLLTSYNLGMPMVLVDRFFDAVNIPYVATNDFEGAFEANEYLIKNGHTHIACIQGLIGTSTNTQRVNGYKEALKNNNLAINSSFITGVDFGFQNGYEQGLEIINKLDQTKITAVFSTSNQISLGLLKVFKENRIRIPDDISIVSFDDQDYSELLYAPLSTVAHADEKMGEKALDLLFHQIEHKDKPSPEIPLLPTHLIKRASVKKLLA
ncbi:MAG: substrate-binding domain-containing protein, partial [Reichenbachiella sp.]